MYLGVLQYVYLLSIICHKECTLFFTVNTNTISSMVHEIIFQYNHIEAYQYFILEDPTISL